MALLFRVFSRVVVEPLFRLRLGALVGNPVSGYLMVILTRGRISGRVRSASVVYAIDRGAVYGMAGYGPSTNWYRNAMAPVSTLEAGGVDGPPARRAAVTLVMPSGTFHGTAHDVTDASERVRALRLVLKNAGLSAFTEGVNPWLAGDEELLRKTAGKPVVRISVGYLRPGPGDPGGWAWLWLPVVLVAAASVAIGVATRARCRAGR